MKYLLVFLAVFASSVYAFQPNDLAGAEIKQVAPCKQFACAVVEKEGKKYLIIGELVGEDNVSPLAIYVVEGKKLRLIWSISWRDS